MKHKQLKFVLGSVAIVLALSYLGFSGFKESMSYYQTVPELYASGDVAYERSLRVEGDVVPGSIVKGAKETTFVIGPENQTLKVRYIGSDPVPDTFRDYAQAVVEGKYGRDGVFTATKMQAKCASKYEKESAAGVNTTKNEGE
jgi:cytochrome c-type biogenesis protein CcmE